MISPSNLHPSDEPLHLVGFRIEHWRFAVRLSQVKTSMLPCTVTRVFHTPPFVQGIISLHGAIVCVLDLGRLLGLHTTGAKHRRFIVLSEGGVEAAIPAHDVFRIPEVMASEVGPVPIHVPPDNRMLLEGILNMSARTKDQPEATEDTITLVNAKTLFDAPALRALRGGV
jgi:purine-binding chemotaxis protein CheW